MRQHNPWTNQLVSGCFIHTFRILYTHSIDCVGIVKLRNTDVEQRCAAIARLSSFTGLAVATNTSSTGDSDGNRVANRVATPTPASITTSILLPNETLAQNALEPPVFSLPASRPPVSRCINRHSASCHGNSSVNSATIACTVYPSASSLTKKFKSTRARLAFRLWLPQPVEARTPTQLPSKTVPLLPVEALDEKRKGSGSILASDEEACGTSEASSGPHFVYEPIQVASEAILCSSSNNNK
ncbi:unnamed protein product [Protopolystoma xenopodis]|uniref:Uncharacterized protein n=1 Tax=Protopolystoma xenopodis TaxID=117903 RepID=A0A448XAM5_9PLAT|nr:unnamed protein product [Protopolystoma xenopodis]